jgi:hypothetical protein
MINKGKKLFNPLGKLQLLGCLADELTSSGRAELRVQDVEYPR